jgi:hypothetical protein
MDLQITEIDLPEMEDGSVWVEAIRAHLECKYFDVVRINNRGDGIFVMTKDCIDRAFRVSFAQRGIQNL